MAVILRYALLAWPFLTGWFTKGKEGAKKANDSSGGTLGKAALWFGAVYLLDKFVLSKINRDTETEKIGTDAAATLANRIRDAFGLYEVFGVKVLGFTDEKALYAIAGEIRATGGTLWERVKTSYATQFGESLLERLRAELSADEFQKFLSILNGQTATPPVVTPAPSGTIPGSTGQGTGPVNAYGKTAIVRPGLTEILYTVAKPRKAVKTVYGNETIGVIHGAEVQTINGKRELYYHSKVGGFWGIGATEVIFYSGKVNLK